MDKILTIIIDYLKFLKPKAHNAITKLIVIAGLALIAPSVVIVLINKVLEKELEFRIISEYDPFWGISLIVIALIYNLIFSKITTPSTEVLVLEFQDNSLWLHYEGTKRIELFALHLELFELSQKKEFRKTQRYYFPIEKILYNKDRFELLSIDTATQKLLINFIQKSG